jgi:hypothetical protein
MGGKLPRQHRHHRIMTQVIVVVEVLIAQRKAKHPLRNKRRHVVLNQVRTAMIRKASGKPVDQPGPAVGCPW